MLPNFLTYNYSYVTIKLIKGVAACGLAVSPVLFETALLQGGRLFLVVYTQGNNPYDH